MKINKETAVQLLNNGHVVAIPTETVYGLASRIDNEAGIRSIFTFKNRPMTNPLIVHVDSVAWLEKLAINIPTYVQSLVKAYWPGPLTIVLEKSQVVPSLVTANQSTVAIRMPAHPMCLDILKSVNCPLVAPSANLSCETSPTTAEHVVDTFGSAVSVVDGGLCQVGIESTIVLASDPSQLTILRPGIITQQEITSTTGLVCLVNQNTHVTAPGMSKKHYSPRKPIILVESKIELMKLEQDNSKKYFFMLLSDSISSEKAKVIMPNNAADYARILYSLWKKAEVGETDAIVIELPPQSTSWPGVLDRIKKAAIY